MQGNAQRLEQLDGVYDGRIVGSTPTSRTIREFQSKNVSLDKNKER